MLSSQQYTILALVTDTHTDTNFHEVFSNWSSTNAGTSVFLGTTNQSPVRARFTDYMGGADDPNHNQTGVGIISSPTVPFVLGGLNTSIDAGVYQNQTHIADNGAAIPARGLTSQYFVGDQGSENGEYWQGNIYEMLVYNGALTAQQMQQDWTYFQVKYFQPVITSLAAPSVTENGPPFTLTVNGTNFDPSATVQWNGTPLTVTSRTGSTQIQVTVPASLITEEGAYNITVTNPEMNGAASAPSPFVVADAPLANVANLAFSATEGIPFSGTVAEFTDTDQGSAGDPTNDPSEYSATITWGDGSTSPGTVAYTGTPGRFTVNAGGTPHTYAEDGVQASNFFVTINHGTLAPVSTAAITVTVADAPLTATATPVTTAVYGVAFSGEVATFTDANPAAPASDFPLSNVTIKWGDGSTSTATAITQPGGTGTSFDVFGSHTYEKAGTTANPLQVTITDVGGSVSNATSYTPTISPYAFSYTINNDSQTYGSPANLAADLPATISTGINGENLDIAYSSSGDTSTADVASYAITGSVSNGTGLLSNYSVTLINGSLAVTQAAAHITVTGYSGVYDGNAHGATGSATGVQGEDLSSLLNLGASFTDVPGGTAHWTFAGNTDYKPADGSVANTISQATATIKVSGYSGVYDGDAHGPTGSATGVQGEDLSSLLNLGASFTDVPGGTAQWTFAGNTDYQAASGNAAITIGQATATIKVSGYSGIYDGNAHGATGSATGVQGEDLSSLLDLGASFTDVPGGTANWSFAGDTDYKSASGSSAITIGQANATIKVSGYSGVYDGNAHGATGTATGVNGDLSSLLDLGDSFTDAPGGTANWAFAGDTDYQSASGSVAITISQANATIKVSGFSGVYDGNAHGATGSATGVQGEDLSSLLNLGASFTDVPGGTAQWNFAGNTDYQSASGSVSITISQATATIKLSGYGGIYDGNAHGATGSATGFQGEALTSLLDLGASFTDVPGGTANWTFAGNTDYQSASGSVAITIAQARANITVNG